jgi:hypothetical protein
VASEVDICNLALGFLGDRATVSSISPPEGSAQAEHCARFYPIARNATLEAHDWGFATKRANLALLSDTPPPGWQFVYQLPNDCLNIIKLIDPGMPAPFELDDWDRMGCYPLSPGIPFVPPEVPYELEARADGLPVVYTKLEAAQIQYVALVTDTTKFSAQFVDALSRLLASYLAGPVIKGDAALKVGQAHYQTFLASLAQAKANDANNRRRSHAMQNQPADWIARR